ncbi:SLBB-domain like (DUF1017) [Cedecea neteri]|uniref:SLBB-domain like (DUF1017) n=1 Tax=Cedecea neteri TaxID=158822 RepID=A0A2X2TCD0_9ENTR|nr:SLBB-domain like (DUF1017) [Cedecea neteri]
MHVTGRQFVNLDPDWVRLRPQANVPLQGEYSLWTGAAAHNNHPGGISQLAGSETFYPRAQRG